MILKRHAITVAVIVILFFLGCTKESDTLTEEEIKTYCNVYPIYAQILESDREFFIKMISQNLQPQELLIRIESCIKGRQDFPDINNRMKALGMSFEQFMRSHTKLAYVHYYYHMFGESQSSFIDSVIKNWSKALIDEKSPERRESMRQFLEKIKNIPKQNVELLKKYDDIITDLWSKPSW